VREAVDALTDGELDQVISAIKQRYVSPNALSDVAVKRATVQGLMERLGASANLILAGTAKSEPTSAFRAEVINERIGYLRLAQFDQANLELLDKELAALSQKGIEAWIIDLRATPAGGDFERAAEVCRRFCPKGKVLFTLKRPETKQAEIFTTKEDPRVHGLMTVLTDSETAGSAEIIAGTLRALAKAVVIGQKTKGAAAEFVDLPLQEGRLLRIAVAEVLLPGDLSVVPNGLQPDVPVDVPKETEEAVLAQEAEKGVAAFVAEAERRRLNEAALVAGTNPELDALQANQGNRAQRPKAPLRDAILQRAVDLITSVAVFEKTRKK
jgi:carboxyl-terminal processing protease